MLSLEAHLADEDATLALGAAMARALEPGLVVHLEGDLGAGKTTLVRGVLRGLGWQGPVKSPTYTLLELYEVSRLLLHHFDFYRFQDPQEWIDAGFRETFNGRNVSLIEWPEKAGELLPPPDVQIVLESSGEGRNASLRSHSAHGEKCLTLTAQCFPYLHTAS
jgi:tRNA threonylcarbamoyladenosine biosynthesis protein TsaE